MSKSTCISCTSAAGSNVTSAVGVPDVQRDRSGQAGHHRQGREHAAGPTGAGEKDDVEQRSTVSGPSGGSASESRPDQKSTLARPGCDGRVRRDVRVTAADEHREDHRGPVTIRPRRQ